MARLKKYHKGFQFTNMKALIYWMALDKWVIIREKPLHPRVVMCMTLETVNNFLKRGMIFRAVTTPEVTIQWLKKRKH